MRGGQGGAVRGGAGRHQDSTATTLYSSHGPAHLPSLTPPRRPVSGHVPRRAWPGQLCGPGPGPAPRQCLDNLEWFRQESRTRQLPTRASAWRGAGRAGRRETHGTVLGVLDAAAALVPAESGPAVVVLNVGVWCRAGVPPRRSARPVHSPTRVLVRGAGLGWPGLAEPAGWDLG